MNRIGILTVLGVVLAIASMAPAAGLVNGSFESGLTGWTTSTSGNGSVTAVSSFENWLPTDGSLFALLKTQTSSSTPQLLYQTPTLAAGTTISFDYFFDQDSLWESIATVSLGGTTVITVDDNTPQTEGQWVHYVSAPLSTTGAYTIQFGAHGQNILSFPSSNMGVDNVVATAPVPEPLTMLAIFSGIGGLGAYIRRRKA